MERDSTLVSRDLTNSRAPDPARAARVTAQGFVRWLSTQATAVPLHPGHVSHAPPLTAVHTWKSTACLVRAPGLGLGPLRGSSCPEEANPAVR